MSRNFGWGQRDMSDAARIALQSTDASFSTVASHVERFSQFKDFCKENGIGRMERVTKELVIAFGKELSDKVDAKEMNASYAQNLVSSVNAVMAAASRGQWQSVSPTRECNIPNRCNIRTEPTPNRDVVTKEITQIYTNNSPRAAACAALAIDLGLRSKEASLFDAKSALKEAENRGMVTISDGTKGGRERTISITHERQMNTLKTAAEAQGNARAVMPPDKNWKEWRGGELRNARESMQAASGGGLHDLRATYACERYEKLTGHPAPCAGGKIEDRQVDHAAREQIARELGHNRIDVVSSYVGGRS